MCMYIIISSYVDSKCVSKFSKKKKISTEKEKENDGGWKNKA